MGLVSKVIPGLYNGISQQSPTIRLDTQGELQENALGTLVDGLIKRPPTEFIALLESLVSENSFIHIIDRDKDEKYIMVVTGNSDNPIEIFTLDGVKCTVQYGTLDEDLVFTENTNIKNYLVSSSPKESIKTVTALDYTIISNSAKSTAMSEQPTANTIPQVVFYVQKGVLSTTYNIWVNDTKVASYTSSDSSSTYRTIDIAQSLYTQMLSNLPNNSLVITYKSTYLHYYPDSTTYVGSIVPALNISITDPDGNVLTYSKAGVDRYHETDIQGSVLAQEVYDALNSLLRLSRLR
jgi:hypothetical protein